MAATSNYLAFDLGASSGRAVLGTFDGQCLKLEEIHRFANGPARILDTLYWDAPRLLDELKTGLRQCAARQVRLDGIGVDTWGVDYGLLASNGELLGLPYHYRDARTRGMFAEAFRRVPRERIYARTGIAFMELNTLYQLLATSIASPAILDCAVALLFMPNLLNYWLTGERGSEYTIASTSQLYSAAGDGWAVDLMGELGLPADIMPPACEPGTVVGDLLPSIVAETGLAPTSVIAPACHDTGSAVVAVPSQGTGWAYISSGTWSLVGVELTEPICTAEALAGSFTNEGGVGGTVRFLKNVAGLWLVQECQRTWAEQGETFSFQQLSDLVDDAPPCVSFVDPDDSRFADPGDMPRRIQDYCAESGQSVPQSPGEVVRCALESLALKYQVNIAAIERLTGRRIEVIHIVGGGVNNTLLCQLTADTTGKPIVAGPSEATAAGNVMVQALARGHVSSLDQVRQVIAGSTQLKHYEPDRAAHWDEARARFETLSGDAKTG